MPRPKLRPITVYRGDTYQHHLTFQDGDGDPIDLTGYTFTAQVRTGPEYDDVLAAMDVTVSALTGEVWLVILPAVTAVLEPGRRTWDVQQVDGDDVVTTLLTGPCDVMGDVTREVAP